VPEFVKQDGYRVGAVRRDRGGAGDWIGVKPQLILQVVAAEGELNVGVGPIRVDPGAQLTRRPLLEDIHDTVVSDEKTRGTSTSGCWYGVVEADDYVEVGTPAEERIPPGSSREGVCADLIVKRRERTGRIIEGDVVDNAGMRRGGDAAENRHEDQMLDEATELQKTLVHRDS
jgi:hypothetical protein